MARAAERVLGTRITAGLVNVKYGHVAKLRRIELNECGHPVPDERGVAGAARIAALAASAGADDLVLCLISGGASALLPLPAPPITLEEKQAVTRLLLACGANIHEINAVRKHISRIKGGQLARLAAPATVEALLLSDVIGDNLDVIGSGPTAPDASTFADAAGILGRYGIRGARAGGGARAHRARRAPARFPKRPSRRTRFSRACATRWWAATAWRSTPPRAAPAQLGFRTLVLSSVDRGRDARDRAHARRHRARNGGSRPAA